VEIKNNKKILKIVVASGGSGGHATPIVAVIDELKKRFGEQIKIFWLGTNQGIERKLAVNEQVEFKAIISGKWRRYFSVQNMLDIFKVLIGILQSLYYLLKIKPQAIFSKGGFVGLPVVIAGAILRKKIVIHESDVWPGLANRLSAKFASQIAVAYQESEIYFRKKVTVTGTPVRNKILAGNKLSTCKRFSLDYQLPTLLVIGGSAGAKFLNDLILASLSELLKHYQIIHLCGKNNYQETKEEFTRKLNIKDIQPVWQNRYHLFTWLDEELADAYSAADLIISRAGANVLAEIAALSKAAILVPITRAGDHQRFNAEIWRKNKAAYVLYEEELKPQKLIETLAKILSNRQELEKIGQNARQFYDPNSAAKIVDLIIK